MDFISNLFSETQQQKKQRQQRQRKEKEQKQWDASITGRLANTVSDAGQVLKDVATVPLNYFENLVQYGKGFAQEAKASTKWGQGDIIGSAADYLKGMYNQSAGQKGMTAAKNALASYALPAYFSWTGGKWLYNRLKKSAPARLYRQRMQMQQGKIPKKTVLEQLQGQLQDYDQQQAQKIFSASRNTPLNRISQFAKAQLGDLYDQYKDQLYSLGRDKLKQGKKFLGGGRQYLKSKRTVQKPLHTVVQPGINTNSLESNIGLVKHFPTQRKPGIVLNVQEKNANLPKSLGQIHNKQFAVIDNQQNII